jgi:hypothetical protein
MSTRPKNTKAKALLEKRRQKEQAQADAQKQAAEGAQAAVNASAKSAGGPAPLPPALREDVPAPEPEPEPEPARTGFVPSGPPPPPPASRAASVSTGPPKQDIKMGALIRDIQKAPARRSANSPRATAEAEIAKAKLRPEALREAGEAVAACLAAAQAAGRVGQLGPGLRVAQALLEAMADGAAASAAMDLALKAEPRDLDEQLQRVEALRKDKDKQAKKEEGEEKTGPILAPRFGDTLAPAQVRTDRALALLGRLRDELSTPPVPQAPARPALTSSRGSPGSYRRTDASPAAAGGPPPPPPPAPVLSGWGAVEERVLDLGGGIKQAALFRDIQTSGGSRSAGVFEEPRVNTREQMLLDIQRSSSKRQAAGAAFEEPRTSSREHMLLEIQKQGSSRRAGDAFEEPQVSGSGRGMLLLEIQAARKDKAAGGSAQKPPPLPAGRGPPGAPPPPPPPAPDLASWGATEGSRQDGTAAAAGMDGTKQAALFRDIHKQASQQSPSGRSFEDPRANSRDQMLLDVQRSASKRQQTATGWSDDDSSYVDPHAGAGVNSREMMLLEIQKARQREQSNAEFKDPHAGLNSREMMLLEIKRRAGEWLSTERQQAGGAGAGYDDDDLKLQPATPAVTVTETKDVPSRQAAAAAAAAQDDSSTPHHATSHRIIEWIAKPAA